jgi:hypothetical protein
MSKLVAKLWMWVMWALFAAWVILMLWLFGAGVRMLFSQISGNVWGLVGFVGIVGVMGMVRIGWYKYQELRNANAWRKRNQ